ncbi:uncharacterized protein LOC121585597 [Coregonus clupeaformis]|uniref:uncharacterized protein LOC121585597 n=1 Tax=Coregonus clupeaformis TaxID=59861 RepID=UPI001BE0475B|nr:uncharacterized protein LOC121585597 [Coregonus clupeaformis]
MILQKFKLEEFAKPGLPRPEGLLTSQAKNTMMHLTGQNHRLASKNVCDSKTPGLHLSATQGGEEEEVVMVSRLKPGSAILPTLGLEGPATQRDSSLLVRSRSPLPGSSRERENLPPRRPLKLAPLELPREVQKAQRQKMKGIGLQAKTAARKLDTTVGDQHCHRKVKACGVRGEGPELVKGAAECVSTPATRPLPLTETAPRVQRQQKVQRADLAHTNPIQRHTGDRLSEDAGTAIKDLHPPPSSKPASPSASFPVSAKAQAQQAVAPYGEESVCQATGTFQQETGKKRLRLRRAERLEEDQSKSNMSTGGLPGEEAKLAGGVQQGKALRVEKTEKALRTEKALKEASRMLEKASRKNARPESPENPLEVSGKAIRRMAVSNLQDAVL